MGVMVGTSKHALRKLRDVPLGTLHIPKLKARQSTSLGNAGSPERTIDA